MKRITLTLSFLIACTPNTPKGTLTSTITESGELKTKVTFDDATSQILVSFAEELEPSQALYLNVRRGDLRDELYKRKDCALVAATPIAVFGDASTLPAPANEAHGTRSVYRLPLVDRALLQSAYNDAELPVGQSWGDGIMTPEKLAILARGIDTFVDICVTTNGVVLRREQADLFRAWDNNNPHIVRDVLATDDNQPRVSSPQVYGELCVASLGEIPFFKNKRQVGTDPVTGRPKFAYDTWDCRDSVHIPVTVTGPSGEVSGPDWDSETGTSPKKCDKRQYIYNLCEQGPRVISAKNEQNTQWVLLCRKGVGQTPKLEQQGVDAQGNPILVDTVPRDQLSTTYNDIAMLGYNPTTGRTCFFQNALYQKKDGAKIPHPADAEKSDTLWSGVHGEAGGINCISCHDNGDALILTPWIAGARRNELFAKAQQFMGGAGKNGWVQDGGAPGTPVVPMMGQHPDRPLGEKNKPYTLVNYKGQGWSHPKSLVGEQMKGCTSCHVIGGSNTLNTWATRSVGLDSTYNQMLTDAYVNDWKHSHYMPFDPRPGAPDVLPPNQSAWETSDYAKAIAHIQQCRNANQSEVGGACQFAELPRESPVVDPRPLCVSDIPDDCDY